MARSNYGILIFKVSKATVYVVPVQNCARACQFKISAVTAGGGRKAGEFKND